MQQVTRGFQRVWSIFAGSTRRAAKHRKRRKQRANRCHRHQLRQQIRRHTDDVMMQLRNGMATERDVI